jgi:hypothetical protein
MIHDLEIAIDKRLILSESWRNIVIFEKGFLFFFFYQEQTTENKQEMFLGIRLLILIIYRYLKLQIVF